MFKKAGSDVAYNFVKLGMGFSGKINFPDDDTYELILVVPEGSSTERCYEMLYETNEGEYEVKIHKGDNNA